MEYEAIPLSDDASLSQFVLMIASKKDSGWLESGLFHQSQDESRGEGDVSFNIEDFSVQGDLEHKVK